MRHVARAGLKARVCVAGGHYKKTNVFLFLEKHCLKLESAWPWRILNRMNTAGQNNRMLLKIFDSWMSFGAVKD